MGNLITYILNNKIWLAPLLFVVLFLVALMVEQVKDKLKDFLKNKYAMNALLVSAALTIVLFVALRWIQLAEFEVKHAVMFLTAALMLIKGIEINR